VLHGKSLVWLIVEVVCLHDALQVQLSVSAGNERLRYYYLLSISCHFRHCIKGCWSPVTSHASSASVSDLWPLRQLLHGQSTNVTNSWQTELTQQQMHTHGGAAASHLEFWLDGRQCILTPPIIGLYFRYFSSVKARRPNILKEELVND